MAAEVDYRLPIHYGLPVPFTEMGRYNQFILWRPERNAEKGKYDKIPISPDTGHTANPLDPINQRSYAEVQIAAQRWEAQIGFVFTESDPFFFVDIDDALLADNKTWSPFANQTATLFAGCAFEMSFNGRGFHVFGQYSEALEHGCKRSDLKIELYIAKRWVALTGHNAIGSARSVVQSAYQHFASWFGPKSDGAKAGASMDDWVDAAVPGYKEIGTDDDVAARMLNEKPSPEAAFGKKPTNRELWDGEIDHYPSPSEAVYALLGKLRFYTGANPVQMLRIFQGSPLGQAEALLLGDHECDRKAALAINKLIATGGDVYTGGAVTDSISSEWPSIERIMPTYGPEFPVDALPTVMRDMVVATAEYLQTPLALAATPALGAMATCLQRWVEIESAPGHHEGLNLYLACIQPPSTRKSSTFKIFQQAFIEYEQSYNASYRPYIVAAEAEIQAQEKALGKLETLYAKDRDQVVLANIQQLALYIDQLVANVPEYLRIMVGDITPEALALRMSESG